jgi:hypothetical protein
VKLLPYYIVTSLLLFSHVAQAAFGDDAALLLAEPLSVRPLGMAGAFTSQADDESSIQVNPAGLSQVRGFSLGGGELIGLLGLEASDLSLVSSINSKLAVGLELAYLSNTDTTRDIFGNEIGSFTDSNTLGILALGYKLSDSWRIGGAIKGLQESYASYNSLAMAADLGVQGPVWGDLRFGAVAQNLGTEIQNSDNASASLPVRLQAGFSLPFFTPSWRFNIEAQDLPLDDQLRALFGTELTFDLGGVDPESGDLPLRAALRGGYADGLLVGESSEASFGAGLELPPTYVLDYALVSVGDLGLTHRISLTLRFPGASLPPPLGANLSAPYQLSVTEEVGGIILSWEDLNERVAGYNLYADYGVMIDRLNNKPIKRRYQRFVNIDKSRTYHFYVRPLGSDGKEGPASEMFTYRAK